MGYSYSADDDYRYWDNTLSVTVTLIRHDGDYDLSISHALQGDQQLARQQFGSVKLTPRTMVWVIPSALLHGHDLQPGDILTYGGETYLIEDTQLVRFESQWILLTNKQR
ncbi:MAG: hypothetical protein ACF8CY_05365 [Gimesia chilikensis]